MSSSTSGRVDPYYALGIDCGTQSMKGIVVDTEGDIIHEVSVHYDTDLPEFGTRDGVTDWYWPPHSSAPFALPASASSAAARVATRTAPTAMFFAAIDLVFSRLSLVSLPAKDSEVDTAPQSVLSRVYRVSVSAQQHGAVWWGLNAPAALAKLRSEDVIGNGVRGLSLTEALLAPLSGGVPTEAAEGVLSVPHGPIWMDSSASAEADAVSMAFMAQQQPSESSLEASATLFREATGARPYPRFTLFPMLRLMKLSAEAAASSSPERSPATALGPLYSATSRVSLLSSALSAVLTGRLTPADPTDAAGTAALAAVPQDGRFVWHQGVLKAAATVLLNGPAGAGAGDTEGAVDSVAGSLCSLLGPISRTPRGDLFGPVAPALRARFGLPEQAAVVAGGGDNPCALVGALRGKLSDDDDADDQGERSKGKGVTVVVSLGTSTTVFATAPASAGPGAAAVFPAADGDACAAEGVWLPHPLAPSPPSMSSESNKGGDMRMAMLVFANGALARGRVASALATVQRAESGMSIGKGRHESDWALLDAALDEAAAAVVADETVSPTVISVPWLVSEITPRITAPSQLTVTTDKTAVAASGSGVLAFISALGGSKDGDDSTGAGGALAFYSLPDPTSKHAVPQPLSVSELTRAFALSEGSISESQAVAASIVRSQILALRHHVSSLGLALRSPESTAAPSPLPTVTRVVLVGGAAASRPLARVVADAFNAPVAALTVTYDGAGAEEELGNAAAYGAALRGLLATDEEDVVEKSSHEEKQPLPASTASTLPRPGKVGSRTLAEPSQAGARWFARAATGYGAAEADAKARAAAEL